MGQKSVILLAFANDRKGTGRFLTELDKEMLRLGEILQPSMFPLVKPAASGEKIRNAFRDYQAEIKIFHYGGHAETEWLETEVDELNQEAYTHIEGLSQFIGLQAGVKLAFLNGCNTQGQAVHFHKSGIPCVIASKRAIGDQEARRFSEEFYKSLVRGTSIQQSFEEAAASLLSVYGKEHTTRGLAFEEEEEENTQAIFPYKLFIKSGEEHVAQEGIKTWEKPQVPISKIIEAPKPVGAKTYLLCNRNEHNNLFEDELQISLRDKVRKPQFFFLHGAHEELPGSLADRFYEFTVRDVLKRLKEPISPGKYLRYEMGFPTKTDFESKRNRDLAFIRLQNHFEQKDLDLPEHGKDLLKKIGHNRRLVLFQHDMMAVNWHEKMPDFIQRYINDFWKVELKPNQPQVVVVFNLTYNLAKGFAGLFKKREDKGIEKNLNKMAESIENCLLIDRLQAVSSDDVAAWQGDYLKEKPELVKELFGSKNKLSMSEIEPVLMRELKKI